jgi:hypothetical protein
MASLDDEESTGPNWTAEEQAGREKACCRSEPECVLCPLLPQNELRSLAELKAMGLKANL